MPSVKAAEAQSSIKHEENVVGKKERERTEVKVLSVMIVGL